jgi:hypothetical protein
MKEVNGENFELVIAYLLPGFVALWGVSYFSATVRSWIAAVPGEAAAVGGFLYVTIGSLAAGLVVNTIRWAVVDSVHHRTGIAQPNWDFAALQKSATAFELLIAHHYRHYQFHANSFVAVALAFGAYWLASASERDGLLLHLALFVAIETVLWLGSRDTLRKSYARGSAMLGDLTSGEKVEDRYVRRAGH